MKRVFTKGVLRIFIIAFALGNFSLGLMAEPLGFEYEIDGKKVHRAYVFGTKPIDIPKINFPQKGKSYLDPAFGCRISRISDRQIDGYHSKSLVVEYSTVDIENSDGTYLMLGSFNHYLYDALTFKMIKPMGKKPRWGYEWEARWHPTEPRLLYYIWKTQLRMRDMTGPCKAVAEDRIVHDFKKEFPDAQRIAVATKGTPSIDGRYWAFGVSIPSVGRKHGFDKAFFYDMKEDTVLWSVDCDNPKWIGTSMSGDYMIIAGGIPGKERAVWALMRENPAKIMKLAPKITHSDLAIDSKGHEVYVYENSTNDFLEMTEFGTGKTTKLISVVHDTGWRELKNAGVGGQHFSGNCWQTPGWILVSTYGGSPKDPKTSCWKKHLHYMLELKKNPRIWRVCHNRSVQGGYWGQAFATINARGTRAYWSANWGSPKGRLEVYVVELPENWYEDLMGREKSAKLRKKARHTLHIE